MSIDPNMIGSRVRWHDPDHWEPAEGTIIDTHPSCGYYVKADYPVMAYANGDLSKPIGYGDHVWIRTLRTA